MSVNRVGKEGETEFWGNSFVCNPMGRILSKSDLSNHSNIVEIDYKEISSYRQTWTFFRDRRVDSYQSLLKRYDDDVYGEDRRETVCQVLRDLAGVIDLQDSKPEIIFKENPANDEGSPLSGDALAAANTYWPAGNGFYIGMCIRDIFRDPPALQRAIAQHSGRNDKLAVADKLMKEGQFRHVVALDEEGRVVGVVSHRDLFYGALAWSTGQGTFAHGHALDTVLVKEVMHTDPFTVAPGAKLAEAAVTMMDGKIGCLPVVDGEELVGILTEGDFLALLVPA